MPDRRRHRGPHPADPALFAASALPVLRQATDDLSWLLGRGYAVAAATALVGDRFQLRTRQRLAVRRAACAEARRRARRARRVGAAALANRALAIDGFNCVVTVEAALAGAVVVAGRDGALRDLSAVHGSYRIVTETAAAIAALVAAAAGAQRVICWLDRPVSNSGRLAARLRAAAPGWQVEVVDAPDRALAAAAADAVVATSDGAVLDRCGAWIDLPAAALAATGAPVWRVAL
ncbi:MAG: DUF434 domain-containing protein [Deltaproteobacteria bacterium]|nr:MAG: DUF434 domain-containing protein [Deltaproteobacteria bacterium]